MIGWFNPETGQWDQARPKLPSYFLSVELVPTTCWYTNVRSNVTAREWEICKNYVKTRSGARCEICGGRGRKWPVECHEIWEYNDDRAIQTLVDLIALCPPCHEVKHIGRAMVMGNLDRALRHLAKVNEWSLEDADHYVAAQLEVHALRSTHPWTLDISWLDRVLGIKVVVKDRP